MQRTSSPAAQRGQPARGGGGGGGASLCSGWALCVAPRCDDVSCVCVCAVCVCVVCVKSRVCKAVVSVGCVCVCVRACACVGVHATREVSKLEESTSPLSIGYVNCSSTSPTARRRAATAAPPRAASPASLRARARQTRATRGRSRVRDAGAGACFPSSVLQLSSSYKDTLYRIPLP